MAKQSTPLSTLLQTRIINFFNNYRPISSPGPLLIAVSGGPDSICLFHLLYELKDKLGIQIHVVHLDHQLRGEEAAGDALFVKELACRFSIPATIETRDVREYHAQHHLSLEEAAREVRYTFFAEIAQSLQAIGIAVGHTMDDNIETILMHLIRGTGTRGLRGLSPVTKWHPSKEGLTIIRPLLEISRQETQQYCRDHMIEARNDKSNISLDFFRNRIRLELRPMLEKYNPKINEALLRTANIAGDELAFLEDQAQRLWMVTAKRKENTIILNKTRMQSQPAALRRQLLRMAMADLAGNLKDIESRHIEEMMELLEKPAGSQISLPYGLKFSAVYNHYLLGPNPTALCPFPLLEGEATLDIPGETRFSGWRITARIVERGNLDIKKTVRAPGIKNYAIPRAGFGAYFDLDRLGNDVKVRAIQTGDRFQPFGLADMKKVGRFMIDTRIPHDWRARIPIIVSTDKVAWVTGYRTDDRFKVTETTRTILKLQFHLQQSPTT